MRKLLFMLLICTGAIFNIKSASEEEVLDPKQRLSLKHMEEFQKEAKRISGNSRSDSTKAKRHRRSSFVAFFTNAKK
jgi:hypothetical protein